MVCGERYADLYIHKYLVLIVLFKVGWFTSDNASNNDTAMKEVTCQLNADKGAGHTKWDRREGRIRCVYSIYSTLYF